MVTTLIDLIFFSINFVPSLVISTLSLITLLLNLYFVHKAEGSFWADFILGLIWLLASATALNFFMSQIDRLTRLSKKNQDQLNAKACALTLSASIDS